MRVSLLVGLAGHWVANLLFDADQYASAGQQVQDHVFDPIAVQTVVVLASVAALTAWGGRRATSTWIGCLDRWPLTGVLLAIQLALFGCFEGTERLALDAAFLNGSSVGPFESGLLAELLVAIGSAVGLAAFGGATVLLLERLRGKRHPRASGPVHRSSLVASRRRSPQPMRPGGERAPPAVLAV